jgi:hypothetical protein
MEAIWKEMSMLVQGNVKMSFCIFILEETFEITNRYRSKVVTFFSQDQKLDVTLLWNI